MASQRDQEFVVFAASRITMLRRTAYLLCGDTYLADDLAQTALTKVYVRWPKLVRRDGLDAYARQVLVHAFYDLKRHASSREILADDPHLHGASPQQATTSDRPEDRLLLMQGLATLPPDQRAVLVLRFWNDLDVHSVASALKIPTGTVKTRTARGLKALRHYLESQALPPDSPLLSSLTADHDEREN